MCSGIYNANYKGLQVIAWVKQSVFLPFLKRPKSWDMHPRRRDAGKEMQFVRPNHEPHIDYPLASKNKGQSLAGIVPAHQVLVRVDSLHFGVIEQVVLPHSKGKSERLLGMLP